MIKHKKIADKRMWVWKLNLSSISVVFKEYVDPEKIKVPAKFARVNEMLLNGIFLSD